MAQPVIQPAFVSGEFSPSLWGRVDLAKYHSAVALGRNFYVDYRGGASNRTGTRFVSQVKDTSKAVRLIPFTFSATQTYALEFGDLYMRVISNGALVIDGGTGLPFVLVTPYAAADLALLKFVQSADTMTFTHTGYTPRSLVRLAHDNWTITPVSFVPTVSAPVGLGVTPSAAGVTTYRYVVTAIASNGIQESLPSAMASTALSAPMSTTVGALETLAWTAVPGSPSYNVYRQDEVIGSAPDVGSLYGFVGATTNNGFVDQNINPDFSNTPPQSNNPFDGGNNPGCTTYFQQRQCYAGSNLRPDSLYMSKSGDYPNFSYSIPQKDDDSISVKLTSQQVNQIQHMIPMTSLIILTGNGAWKVDGGTQSDAVTPTHILALPQAYNGCSDKVPPIVVNSDILYVQAKGSIVRDLSYNYYVNIFTGADMTIMSNHLFFGHTIVEWCWAEEPFKLVWAVRDDGVLLSLTYLKEQDIYGWMRHDTDGRFKSCCSISEGQENAVYFIVERNIGGGLVQYIERMASRNIQGDVTQAWHLDCALQTVPAYLAAGATPADLSMTLPDDGGIPAYGNVGDIGTINADADVFNAGMVGRVVRINGGWGFVTAYVNLRKINFKVMLPLNGLYPTVVNTWSCTAPVSSVSGLSHLEGRTVSILGDGSVQPPQIVVGGAINLPNAAAWVTVGLSYRSQLRTLSLDIGDPTIQGKRKTVPAVTVRVVETRGLRVGPNFNNMTNFKERSDQPYTSPIQLITADERVPVLSDWTVTGQVCIEQPNPLPATISAVIPEVIVGDTD